MKSPTPFFICTFGNSTELNSWFRQQPVEDNENLNPVTTAAPVDAMVMPCWVSLAYQASKASLDPQSQPS